MILSIGNINVDLICNVPRLPMADDKINVSELSIMPGGGASNFAVGLSRLGSPVALFGHVGNDRNGKIGLHSLLEENIDITKVIIEDNYSTGFVIILVDEKGETAKIGYRDANALLHPQEITEELLKDYQLVHSSSVSTAVALQAANVCKKLGSISSIDFGAELMNESVENLRRIVNAHDFIFMNRVAFERTYQCKPNSKAVRAALENEFKIMNVTLGERGSLAITRDEIIEVPAWSVPVVDTTGAGEAYAAGFIHYYLNRMPIQEIGPRAAACAALQISLANAREGMPYGKDVEEFLKVKAIQQC